MRPWLVVVLTCAACGSSSPAIDAPGTTDGRVGPDGRPGPDAFANPPGEPHLGAHVLAYHRLHSGIAPLDTDPVTTADANSTVIISVGRGQFSAHAPPVDNENTTYSQLDQPHIYTRYTGSGTALYGATGVMGGAGHHWTASTPSDDEITMGVVEVRDAGTIQDVQWIERLAPPLTSATVTTTGPATLVAFWWGDADVAGDKTAVPDSGFTVVDSILLEGALVQCAVATRDVQAAGTYSVTWTSTPTQGAQLWLVAVR